MAKFDIESFRAELTEEIRRLLSTNTARKQQLKKFKSNLKEWFNTLDVTNEVKRTKLPRKLKKQYKKNHMAALDVTLTFPPLEHLIVDIEVQ